VCDSKESPSTWKSLEESIQNAYHPPSISRVYTGFITIQHLQRSINKMKDDEYFIIAMYPTHYENDIKEIIAGNDHIPWPCNDLLTEHDEEHRTKRKRLF